MKITVELYELDDGDGWVARLTHSGFRVETVSAEGRTPFEALEEMDRLSQLELEQAESGRLAAKQMEKAALTIVKRKRGN